MKIATWNVNSVKVRIGALLAWLKEAQPDVVCLQEIKVVDEGFPALEIEALGYNVATLGQKTYNGVALLSKHRLEDVTRGLPGFADEQARYIEAAVSAGGRGVRIASIYLPNGNPAETEKYAYKLAFMDALRAHARALLAHEEVLVMAGDYNVIPEPADVYDPAAWETDALYKVETRRKYRALLALGFTDAFRACHAEPRRYTFWDYQAGAWQKDKGIRIDHLLLSPQAADRLTGCEIDRHVRGWEQPSDHVPIWCTLDV